MDRDQPNASPSSEGSGGVEGGGGGGRGGRGGEGEGGDLEMEGVLLVCADGPVDLEEQAGDELGAGRRPSSRPATPSGGIRKACVVHLDGCRYTIVASPHDHVITSKTDVMSTSSSNDTSFPRTGSLTLLKKTLSSGSTNKLDGRPTCVDATAASSLAGSGSGSTDARHDVAKASSSSSSVDPWNADGDTAEAGPLPPLPLPSGTTTTTYVEMDELEKLSAVDSSLTPQLCSLRLRHLLSKVSCGHVDRDDVAKNLERVIRLLDSVYTKDLRSEDEEAELNRVETEAVPNEVRDWLAMTFTRSTHGVIKREGSEKPKFRSVAHAIRAGILVDRIYRRVSSYAGRNIPTKIVELLKTVDEWSFDVFALDDASEGHALKFIGYDLMQRYDLIGKFKISTQTLESLLVRLENGYSKYSNPYHNLVHAADVAQTMHHVISKSGLSVWLTDVDILSIIVAALIHDFEHTGTTNTFHVNTSSDMALLYNDRAILENHHVSASFRLLREDEFNIVSGLKAEEYREFRSLVIDMILATDMSYHFQQIKNMKTTLNLCERVDKTRALSLIVHCCDISHPAKNWDLHRRWTELLIEEFFRQGDREASLGLQISPLCDRKSTLVAESQIGFIDYIVDPSLQVMGDMIERIIEENDAQMTTDENTANDLQTTTDNDKLTANDDISDAHVLQSRAAKCRISRDWESCLVANKRLWKERADKGWISPLQQN